MIVCSDRQIVADFFKDRLGLYKSEDLRGVLWVPDEYALKVRDPDDIAVAVGFNAFIGRTCCIHTVIQRPELLTRYMIRETFNYVYNVCGVETVLGLVDSTNHKALEFDRKLGFKELYRIPNGGIDEDLVVLGMNKSECKWIKENQHGKEIRPACA